MALFGFRIRRAERDRKTDMDRVHRIVSPLANVLVEMERERMGLRERYEKVMADAAFSQLKLEDEPDDARTSSKIDAMTNTMIRYARRAASLDSQISFFTVISRRIERLTSKIDGDENGRRFGL